MPAQIGSRCSSAPLTSAGVAARVCSTMPIICAVRSADGRCTTAPPTLPRRTEIRPSTLQDVDRLAQRGRAHPELVEQGLLRRQHVAFLEAAGQDVVPQPRRHDLGDPRLADALRRGPCSSAAAACRTRPRSACSGAIATAFISPMQSTSSPEQQPRRRRDRAVDLGSGDVEAQFGQHRRRPAECHGQRSRLAGQRRGAVLVLGDAVEEHGEEPAVHQSRRPLVTTSGNVTRPAAVSASRWSKRYSGKHGLNAPMSNAWSR